MRKLLVTLDDDISPLLAKYTNQNEIVRQALRLYIGDITPDTVDALRKSFEIIKFKLNELDQKIDYIAKIVQ